MLVVQQETTAKNRNGFLFVLHLVQALDNDSASGTGGNGVVSGSMLS